MRSLITSLLALGILSCSPVPVKTIDAPGAAETSQATETGITESLKQFGVNVRFVKGNGDTRSAVQLSWAEPPESLEDCVRRYDVASIVFEYLTHRIPASQRPEDVDYGDFNCASYEEDALVSGEINFQDYERDVDTSLRQEVLSSEAESRSVI